MKHLDPNEGYVPSRVPREWYESALDLKAPAELLEVIGLLVDAMRRSDPDYCAAHECDQCSEEDWDIALAAGEDALEANR